MVRMEKSAVPASELVSPVASIFFFGIGFEFLFVDFSHL